MKRISLVFLVAITAHAQSSSSDLCAQKKSQYGKNFISCSEVDWGVTPLSSDFQPGNFGPMTTVPSQIPGFHNDYPEIRNTDYYSTQSFKADPTLKGLDLLSKFATAVAVDSETQISDPNLKDYLTGPLYNSLQSKPGTAAWGGKCFAWSAMSMDQDVQAAFAKINKGIICSGVPFTRGELKEIITALYPEPNLDIKRLSAFYTGYKLAMHPDIAEDANVALSKLGVLGKGDISPEDVIDLARQAYNSNPRRNMALDHDPGPEVWNQPIKKITDVAYRDDSADIWSSLSSAEFANSTNSTSPFLSDLQKVESDLTQSLMTASPIDSKRLCSLRTELGQTCDDLNGTMTMTEQVKAINQMKLQAYQSGVITQKVRMGIVKHEMIVEYGLENKFASNDPDHTETRSYSYTSVHATDANGGIPLNADGTLGGKLRSNWSPQTTSLAKICGDRSLAAGRLSTSLTDGVNFDKSCADGKLASHEYFIGAVPPNNFKSLPSHAQFTSAQKDQERAYQKALEFIGKCDHFDAALDYLKHLEERSRDNSFSAEDVAALNQEWKNGNVKKLVSPAYLKSLLDNNYQKVPGVSSLKFD